MGGVGGCSRGFPRSGGRWGHTFGTPGSHLRFGGNVGVTPSLRATFGDVALGDAGVTPSFLAGRRGHTFASQEGTSFALGRWGHTFVPRRRRQGHTFDSQVFDSWGHTFDSGVRGTPGSHLRFVFGGRRFAIGSHLRFLSGVVGVTPSGSHLRFGSGDARAIGGHTFGLRSTIPLL
jgi:hypothetical protein